LAPLSDPRVLAILLRRLLLPRLLSRACGKRLPHRTSGCVSDRRKGYFPNEKGVFQGRAAGPQKPLPTVPEMPGMAFAITCSFDVPGKFCPTTF